MGEGEGSGDGVGEGSGEGETEGDGKGLGEGSPDAACGADITAVAINAATARGGAQERVPRRE